jgi:hypothetical protein
MANFLYPRTISVSRPNPNTGVGAQPYGALQETNETTIATGISAKVQIDRQGTKPTTALPGDAAGDSIWNIIFKASLGLVQDRDVITDDLGKRYQVISAYWGPLVTTCRCQILEN